MSIILSRDFIDKMESLLTSRSVATIRGAFAHLKRFIKPPLVTSTTVANAGSDSEGAVAFPSASHGSAIAVYSLHRVSATMQSYATYRLLMDSFEL